VSLCTYSSSITRRERLRSRFRVAAWLLGVTLLLAACSNHFGAGITELPAARGWQSLPIGSWVLNDGVEARAMAFCPRDACVRQGFAALIALEGRQADRVEQALTADPARLAREFARAAAPGKDTKPKRPARPEPPKSDTAVTRFAEADANGLLVEIRAREGGKSAFTAVLSGRDAGRLVIAIGVSSQAEAARTQALAAWRDR
jgi:hypothetical protein